MVAWVTFPSAGFAYTAGQPATYRSSAGVARTFCRECGTPLTYERTDAKHELDVTTCSLDTPDALPPADHTWTGHKLAWMHLGDGLPAFPAARESEPDPSVRA